MDPAIEAKLIALNREFYGRFANEFSSSRSKLHDGILTTLAAVGPFDSMVDLGCGDARVGRAWVAGDLPAPWREGRSRYLGLDNATELLEVHPSPSAEAWLRLEADLSAANWDIEVGLELDLAVCFSVLHHIPGAERRRGFVSEMRRMLRPGGQWIVSVWQILHLERFRKKVCDPLEAGVEAKDLDAGDVVLDWQRGGRGLRYVHEFDQDEIVNLFNNNGMNVDSVYRHDGATGDLGLYLVGTRG